MAIELPWIITNNSSTQMFRFGVVTIQPSQTIKIWESIDSDNLSILRRAAEQNFITLEAVPAVPAVQEKIAIKKLNKLKFIAEQ